MTYQDILEASREYDHLFEDDSLCESHRRREPDEPPERYEEPWDGPYNYSPVYE
jgi:hypothetical protein